VLAGGFQATESWSGIISQVYILYTYTALKGLSNGGGGHECTDKKNFLIYKEIQNGAVAKSYMTDGLLIYD
jgi:hypothetical protein